MTAPLRNHPTLRTLLLCALYAFVLLFFLSPDSYLRDLYYRCDSAIFFMCGKAWMNGMIPYVDFADSKGPLLWLIYGLGYLLNHHSYVGVFWISILFYTATLYIAYKLSRLFLEPRPSALCVAILPLALFFYVINAEVREVRAEDFCMPFVLISLYGLCRVIKEQAISKYTFFWLSVGMGISFMACLLIKWNIAAMIGSTMLCVFILSFKQKAWALCIGGMIAGAAILALPFLIYFFFFADFGVFVDEYFMNTYLTMQRKSSVLGILTFEGDMLLKEIIHEIIKDALTIVLFIGVTIFCKRDKRYAWLLFCVLMFRVAMGVSTAKYYFAILSPFFIFFLIAIVRKVQEKWPQLLSRSFNSLCVLVAIFVICCDSLNINLNFLDVKAERKSFYDAAYVMSQVEKPKMFMCGPIEGGLGVPVDALPSCRYWTSQAGATEEMLRQREKAVQDRIPDFILVGTMATHIEEERQPQIEKCGYVPYVIVHGLYKDGIFALYGRPGLKLPPEEFHVSQWDVWLKRNIFGI